IQLAGTELWFAIFKGCITQSPAKREQGIVSCPPVVVKDLAGVFGRLTVIEYHLTHAAGIAERKSRIWIVVAQQDIADRLRRFPAAPIGHEYAFHRRSDARNKAWPPCRQYQDDGFARRRRSTGQGRLFIRQREVPDISGAFCISIFSQA